MQRFKNFFGAAREWNRIAGYSNRKIINDSYRYLTIVEYDIDASSFPEMNDKKILFFSDLHYGSTKVNIDKIQKILDDIKPDWIIFGGDLITYACHQENAFNFLNALFRNYSKIPKLAVYGNWDRKRNKWYPNSNWIQKYEKVGFKLIINENIEFDNINFYGLDEPRIGHPEIKNELLRENKLNCIISHSVEPVIDKIHDTTDKVKRLYLCGHSHGGQIRLPMFGAMLTSTKYWKLFEYGHYFSPVHNVNLIMTSGIGTTRLPFRLFCDSEAVIVRFSTNNNNL